MAETATISGSPSQSQSTDYELLREEGLRYIRRVAGKIWTDHNIHDPGITILESLCYAITELGYRVNQPMEDILHKDSGQKDNLAWKHFFTAAEILPNAPLTLIDYRKLIIDLPFVRNCWVVKSTDTEIDPYPGKDDDGCTQSEHPDSQTTGSIKLKGLFDVLIEFEENRLNNFDLDFSFDGPDKEKHRATVILPHWDEVRDQWPKGIFPSEFTIRQISSNIVNDNDDSITGFYIELSISSGSYDWQKSGFPVSIELHQPLTSEEGQNWWSQNIRELLEGTFGTELFMEYNSRIQKAFSHLKDIRSLLNSNRNLCEDFNRIKGTRIQKIAVRATIQTKHLFQREEVLAEIYARLDQYLTPGINFYSLEHLLDKGRDPDEIFNGPLLEHGFIDNDDLASFKDREAVYTSDLVRIIMGIPDVVGVSDISVSNFVRNQFIRKADDCLRLNTEIYKPKLSIDLSQVSFTPDYPIDPNKLKRLLDEKREVAIPVPTSNDLPLPKGENLKINEYYSIQNDFPQVYGIGHEGLNSSVSEQRKAQATQLKSYLLFFEQLLANFLSQLHHVEHLLSMSPHVRHTYYYQPLYQIPNVSPVLNSGSEDWEAFIANPDNIYEQHLQEITEDDTKYTDRRNRFLDHLIGRFSEDFTDYALTMLNQDEGYRSQLIHDKVDMLNNYDDLSRNRGIAFNYKKTDTFGCPAVWDSQNISGVEKRIYAKLGLDNHVRRKIYSDKRVEELFEIYEVTDQDNTRMFGFRLVKDGQVLLSSTRTYQDPDQLRVGMEGVVTAGIHNYNYRCSIATNGKFFFGLVNRSNELIAKRIELFESELLTDQEIKKIVSIFRKEFWTERFYLIENILLRPKIQSDITTSSIVQFLKPFEGVTISLNDPNNTPDPDKLGSSLETHFIIFKYNISEAEVSRQAYGFKVFDLQGKHRLTSIEPIYSVYELRQTLNDVARFGIQKGRYYKKTEKRTSSTRYWFELIGWYDQPIAICDQPFGSSRARMKAINSSVELFETFHEEKVLLQDRCLTFPKGLPQSLQNDPFSFRAIAVLPLGAGRFSDPFFCALAEKKLHEEMPAHIVLEVIWAREYDFLRFERAYKHWLLENYKDKPIAEDSRMQYDYELHKAHRELLETIAMIRCNSGVSSSGEDEWDGMSVTNTSDDPEVHFWNDFLITDPYDEWVVGEMTVGKEFVIGKTCDFNDVIGEMIVGQDFKIAYSFHQKYETGVGYGSVGRNFFID